MVLPASAADPGRASVWEPLGVIARLLDRSDQGVLVLLREAIPTQLGMVVRALSPEPPWSDGEDVLRVALQASELESLPKGSRVFLRVREQDIDWLNLVRPMFDEERLRAVMWVDAPTLDPLLRRAVDLVDWVSRSHEVPPRRWPSFAVQGVSAALEHGVPFTWDGSAAALRELLVDLGWTEGVVELSSAMTFREMLRRLEAPGLAVVEGIASARDVWRARMALARAGREGAWVSVQPKHTPAGMWRLSAQQLPWDEAAQRLAEAGWERAAWMAAWVELEPEGIDLAAQRVGQAPADPASWDATRVAVGDAPGYVLRARVGDEAIERARAVLLDGAVPADDGALAVWSEGSSAWRDADQAAVEARLVRALRMLRETTPTAAMVEAAESIGFRDVAAELQRIRFEQGEESSAGEVVDWLYRSGETDEALRVARVWDDRGSNAWAAKIWLGDFHRARGDGAQARRYYEDALRACRTLAERQPGRAELQRDLSVSHNKLGDLHRALGNGAQARRCYEKALRVRQQLVARQPSRADLQRDLSVSYNKLGDLHQALGDGGRARRYYEDALRVRQLLVEQEPARADLQRDLSVSYERLGDLHRAQGNGAQAARYYEDALVIAKQLVAREPGRADLQRDLSVSYERLGDLHRAQGNGAQAGRYYEDALRVRQQLVAHDSGRADLQRDLSVSYNKLGDLEVERGNGERARQYYEDALRVRQQLVDREPERADLQRDLSVSYERLGDLQVAQGNGDQARRQYEDALRVRQQLVEREPGRADLQRDLSVSYERLAVVDPGRAVEWLNEALEIRRARRSHEPNNAVVQRELAVVLYQLSLFENEDSVASAENRREASELLEDLRRRDALESRYVDLADQLAAEVDAKD